MRYLKCLKDVIKDYWITAIILFAGEYPTCGFIYLHAQISTLVVIAIFIAAFRYHKQSRQIG